MRALKIVAAIGVAAWAALAITEAVTVGSRRPCDRCLIFDHPLSCGYETGADGRYSEFWRTHDCRGDLVYPPPSELP